MQKEYNNSYKKQKEHNYNQLNQEIYIFHIFQKI